MSIGENVREKRLLFGFTQEELAEKLQVKQAFIANIERGAKIPSLYMALTLAEIFGCTVEELAG